MARMPMGTIMIHLGENPRLVRGNGKFESSGGGFMVERLVSIYGMAGD